MNKLSVVISAYNEEKIIASCLKSVSFADEIIVVDNSSTDSTASIAKDHNAVVFKRPNNPMLNVNKNVGFTKATGKWILNLDADEVVDKVLKNEIIALVKIDDSQFSGYRIPRKNKLFGKDIMHSGWYPDFQNRLFLKGRGSFAQVHVHEHVKIDGVIGTLSGHILHDSFRSISQFIAKHDLYSSNEAGNYIKDGYTLNKLDLLRFPKNEFISRYFARRGYKDGFHGLALSLLMASYHLFIFLKIWEKLKFVDQKITTKELENEVTSTYDEVEHWFAELNGISIGSYIKRKIRKFL